MGVLGGGVTLCIVLIHMVLLSSAPNVPGQTQPPPPLFPIGQVRSIECKRQSVKEVNEGQSATFAVRSLNRRVALRRATFRKVRGWESGGVRRGAGGDVGVGGWRGRSVPTATKPY